MGPCIEIWADRPTKMPTGSAPAWMRARRAWRDAVVAWVERTGWDHDGRPAQNAYGLGRIRHPWSRELLLKLGRLDWLEWLEGRTDHRPDGKLPVGWDSNT